MINSSAPNAYAVNNVTKNSNTHTYPYPNVPSLPYPHGGPPQYTTAPPHGAPYSLPPNAYTNSSYSAMPAPPAVFESPVEELRTIFISGFPNGRAVTKSILSRSLKLIYRGPADVKERELNNMLRFLPGYQASQMNWKNGQAQGFAIFDTGASAVYAVSMIAHVQFDETSALRAEMARKNMFVKDDGAKTATAGVGGAKRTRLGAPPGGSAPPVTTTYVASGASGGPAVAPKGFAEVSNIGDNQPCSTLFIGNLSDDVNEAELLGLFAGQAGFKQIKVVRGARNITSFIEFEDLNTAIATHMALQGAILQSSNRGGIRIQYSKNPLGKRKDS